ncbi:MAG: hypothetical protein IKF18_05725 [Erysipelotrichaceae bacterium]|nr:hypothetical protein [Erysipelotrichaceae bacterium]MBR3150823.1 hypothetical protein [Erysipelotrichaceae bacterium]MBR3168163.1 hypothetical protein [Erysipelotrichaceae bacterium]
MKVSEMIEKTGFKTVVPGEDREVNGVYCGDLLSWVMGNGQPEQAWITVQSHLNVIAVAVLREFSCIVLAENAEFPEEVIERAKNEGLTLLYSDLPVYETAVRLFKAGV